MKISWPVENLSHTQLIAIPLVLAAIFGGTIAYHWNSTGNPVPLSMEFAGGSFVRIQNIGSLTQTQASAFQNKFQDDFTAPNPNIHLIDDGIEIETSEDLLETGGDQTPEDMIRTILSEIGVDSASQINIESMGSIITRLYKSQARNAAIAAIVIMAIVLFISLRDLTTVGNILIVIGLDFLGILGGMVVLDIPLSLASMAGVLLIFGYAVNTNILLSTNILKKKGDSPRIRAGKAMSTGIKMSSTSATAILALNLLTSAPELYQLSAVLIIGILVDMINTWFLNSGLILMHQKNKVEKYHARI